MIVLKRKMEVEVLIEAGSVPGAYYLVKRSEDDDWTCSCPDHQMRQNLCKHIHLAKEEIKI